MADDEVKPLRKISVVFKDLAATVNSGTVDVEVGPFSRACSFVSPLFGCLGIAFKFAEMDVLKVFPYPVTVTVVQFAVGFVLVLLMWGLNLYKKPKISGSQHMAILPLAFVHTLGNLFTNMSLGKVAVSFTHTIKATEPLFSVLLSAMFLGEGLERLIQINGNLQLKDF